MVKMNVQTGELEKPPAAASAGQPEQPAAPQFGAAVERKGPGYDDGSQGGDLTDLSGDAAEARGRTHEKRSRARDATGAVPVERQAVPPALPTEAAHRQPSAPDEADAGDPDDPADFHKLQKGHHLHGQGIVPQGRPMVQTGEDGRPAGRAKPAE